MKVKENISVYICEHCGKRMFRMAAMVKHEVACYSNPENDRACSGCVHLEQIKTSYVVDTYNGEREVPTNGFRCKKLDKMLFPYKVEKKGLNTKYPESFENQEPMPKKCAEFNPFYE